MKKTVFFFLLGIGMMLASCSQNDDGLQDNQKGTVTFTVKTDDKIDLRATNTRAVTDPSDEAITRAVLEIYDEEGQLVGSRINGTINEDNITFTAQLEETGDYTCLFWADRGENAYYITDFKAIARGTNPSIAYFASKKISASETTVDVTLTHAVAKVVLDETGTLNTGDNVGISFNLPEYMFNISDGSCSKNGQESISDDFLVDNVTTGQVGSLYVFAPVEGADVVEMTLSYTPASSDKREEVVSNIPLKRNHRTVLKGEFENISSSTHKFNVLLDKNWAVNNEHPFPKRVLTTTAPGQIDDAKINEAIMDGGILYVEGPVNEVDLKTISTWTKSSGGLNKLDLSGITGVTEIGFRVFADIPLKSIILPPSLKIIGNNAFLQCGLTEIEIPDGVTDIGDQAFWNIPSLTSVILPASLNAIGNSAFFKCGLKEIEIPADVTLLDNGAFANCKQLEKVILSNNLEIIGEGCFGSCENLKSIILPDKLKTIMKGAFSSTKLTGVIIPANVELIGSLAFYANSLNYVIFESTLPISAGAAPVAGKLIAASDAFVEINTKPTLFALLPNISDKEIVKTYSEHFKEKSVYYNYQNTTGDGDKSNPDNYSKYN